MVKMYHSVYLYRSAPASVYLLGDLFFFFSFSRSLFLSLLSRTRSRSLASYVQGQKTPCSSSIETQQWTPM